MQLFQPEADIQDGKTQQKNNHGTTCLSQMASSGSQRGQGKIGIYSFEKHHGRSEPDGI